MFAIMTEPLDDTPPPEELEMAVEEMMGRPFPGKPEERIDAIKKRIAYLHGLLLEITGRNPHAMSKIDSEMYSKTLEELANAKLQLQDWQAQHEGRN